MTKLMEKALDAVLAWPADRQDEAAMLLLALDRLGPGRYRPSPEELAAIEEALAQTERGERSSKLDDLMSRARKNHNAGRREEF
jgi:hypothetical protein